MDSHEQCQFCKETIDYKKRFPLVMNCNHVICQMCRDNFSRPKETTPGHPDEILKCPTCNTESLMNSKVLNKHFDLYKESSNIILKNSNQLQKKKHVFTCQTHKQKKIKFYSENSQEFLCCFCVCEKEISKKNTFVCSEDDITRHALKLLEKVNNLKRKIQEQVDSLIQISSKNKELTSVDL